MRILQLGKFYPIRGGVESVMWNATKGLAEKGIACDMLCARFKADAPDPQDVVYQEGFGFTFTPDNKVYCDQIGYIPMAGFNMMGSITLRF